MLKPQRVIENHEYDWIFQLALIITIVASIINIYTLLDSKQKSKDNLLIHLLVILGSLLLLIYHFFYRWQLDIVLIFLVILIARTIERILLIFKIKNIF